MVPMTEFMSSAAVTPPYHRLTSVALGHYPRGVMDRYSTLWSIIHE